jgi:hypothetical protein
MRNWILAAWVVVLLLLPVKVRCGSPRAACAIPPVPEETAPRYYYEYQPLGVTWLEILTRSNLPFYYSSGIESG